MAIATEHRILQEESLCILKYDFLRQYHFHLRKVMPEIFNISQYNYVLHSNFQSSNSTLFDERVYFFLKSVNIRTLESLICI